MVCRYASFSDTLGMGWRDIKSVTKKISSFAAGAAVAKLTTFAAGTAAANLTTLDTI